MSAMRGVGIVVQLLVADPDAVLVGQAGGGLGQQQLKDVVAVLAEPGDGPKNADLGDRGRQPVQDAERDRRLAGVALGSGYIDGRSGHRPSFPYSAQPAQPRFKSFRKSSRNRRWSLAGLTVFPG